MSPANAVKDHLRDWYFGPAFDDYISMAIIADGTYYNIPKGMAFSLPVKPKNLDYKVITQFHIMEDHTPWELVKDSIKEIEEEFKSINFKI